jgi:alanine-glyoxylate transaminase/serine-glyoxylate transaminase/serine-pyruvate transaminase
MIPGPVEMDDDLMAVMGRQTAAHYGPGWVNLYRETVDLMQQAFVTTEAEVLFLFSSGTGGLEAAIGSLFARGERVLIVNNGFFGQRLANITQALGIGVVMVTAVWGQPINPQAVRDALNKNPDVQGILVVHHETSTGVLNPIQELGAVAREFDVSFVVDAIASLGGDRLLMDEWGIDICITATNKCLAGPVGLSPIAIHPRAWAVMDGKARTAAGWYLNLKTWRKYVREWGDWHPSPVTMSSQSMTALNLALTKLLAEGMAQRWACFAETAAHFRQAMKERGFRPFVEGEHVSSVITAVNRLPDMDITHFIQYLAEHHHIQISGGLGELHKQVFRVGHMGKARDNMGAFLQGVDAYLAVNRKP